MEAIGGFTEVQYTEQGWRKMKMLVGHWRSVPQRTQEEERRNTKKGNSGEQQLKAKSWGREQETQGQGRGIGKKPDSGGVRSTGSLAELEG